MKNDKEKLPHFPEVKKSIEDFIADEDGNITRSKLAIIGTMVMVMSLMILTDTYADHASHVSHSSTAYIRSHSNHSSGTHSSQPSQPTHSEHASHGSHTSHANTATHSNSQYSSEGDVSYGPDTSSIPSVNAVTKASGYAAGSNTAISALNVSIPQIPKPTGLISDAGNAPFVDMTLPKIPKVPDAPATITPPKVGIPNFETPVKVELEHPGETNISGKV